MILGHYGLAFAGKRLAPRTSLGTLTFAAQWLDELWPVLLLTGVEHVRPAPGLMAANALDFSYYPYSHSLLMAVVWSIVIGGGYYLFKRDGAASLTVGALVVSHWLLDLPMHRPDLPLAPGSSVKLGLGGWNSIPLTLVLELGIFGIGLASYVRRTKSRDRIGTWALWIGVVLLLAILASGFAGPPPADEKSIGAGALALWLFVPLFAWADRHRAMETRLADVRSMA
jgi:hypothetical protein